MRGLFVFPGTLKFIQIRKRYTLTEHFAVVDLLLTHASTSYGEHELWTAACAAAMAGNYAILERILRASSSIEGSFRKLQARINSFLNFRISCFEHGF